MNYGLFSIYGFDFIPLAFCHGCTVRRSNLLFVKLMFFLQSPVLHLLWSCTFLTILFDSDLIVDFRAVFLQIFTIQLI